MRDFTSPCLERLSMLSIIRDTREQMPYFDSPLFETYGVELEILTRKLHAGDYSIEGLEDKILIERKANTGELHGNIGKVKHKERFYRELEKLKEAEEAYILCEWPESNNFTFPQNSGIPLSKMKYIKMSSKYFRKLIHEIQEEFPTITFIYCKNRYDAEKQAFKLLKKVYAKYGV